MAAVQVKAFFVFVLLGLAPAVAKAQSLDFGMVMPDLRAQLAQDWTTDPEQVERAYCITEATQAFYTAHDPVTGKIVGKDRFIRVYKVEPAEVEGASSYHIDIVRCAAASGVIHTHPPVTCGPNGCKTGGIDAYECMPSRTDYLALLGSHTEWGVVQCGPEQFVFYWAKDYR